VPLDLSPAFWLVRLDFGLDLVNLGLDLKLPFKISVSSVASYQISLLPHDAARLKETVESFLASFSAKDLVKTNAIMLYLFINTYNNVDIVLTYRWEFGRDFAHRQVGILRILLDAGAQCLQQYTQYDIGQYKGSAI
jgi:hypothetical protein